jgi:hypothetical protein
MGRLHIIRTCSGFTSSNYVQFFARAPGRIFYFVMAKASSRLWMVIFNGVWISVVWSCKIRIRAGYHEGHPLEEARWVVNHYCAYKAIQSTPSSKIVLVDSSYTLTH